MLWWVCQKVRGNNRVVTNLFVTFIGHMSAHHPSKATTPTNDTHHCARSCMRCCSCVVVVLRIVPPCFALCCCAARMCPHRCCLWQWGGDNQAHDAWKAKDRAVVRWFVNLAVVRCDWCDCLHGMGCMRTPDDRACPVRKKNASFVR